MINRLKDGTSAFQSLMTRAEFCSVDEVVGIVDDISRFSIDSASTPIIRVLSAKILKHEALELDSISKALRLLGKSRFRDDQLLIHLSNKVLSKLEGSVCPEDVADCIYGLSKFNDGCDDKLKVALGALVKKARKIKDPKILASICQSLTVINYSDKSFENRVAALLRDHKESFELAEKIPNLQQLASFALFLLHFGWCREEHWEFILRQTERQVGEILIDLEKLDKKIFQEIHQAISICFSFSRAFPLSDSGRFLFSLSSGLVRAVLRRELESENHEEFLNTDDILIFINACARVEFRDRKLLQSAAQWLRDRNFFVTLTDFSKALRFSSDLDKLGASIPELDAMIQNIQSNPVLSSERISWIKQRVNSPKRKVKSQRCWRKF